MNRTSPFLPAKKMGVPGKIMLASALLLVCLMHFDACAHASGLGWSLGGFGAGGGGPSEEKGGASGSSSNSRSHSASNYFKVGLCFFGLIIINYKLCNI